MKLTKNGQVISLENQSHIDAFIASGWAEVKASAQKPAEKPVEAVEKAEAVDLSTTAPKAVNGAEKAVKGAKKPAVKKKSEK